MPKGPSKKAMLEQARTIIDRNAYGVPFSADDVAELSEVTGAQVSFAVRRRNPEFPNDTRHVHVIVNGWGEPRQWSWRRAIQIARDRDPEEAARMRRHHNEQRALRYAIRPDLRDFLSGVSPAECGTCGSTTDLTVDHVGTPFIAIAAAFLRERPPLQLESRAGVGDLIADIDVEADWISYHAARATYAVLCRSCNARKGARGLV